MKLFFVAHDTERFICHGFNKAVKEKKQNEHFIKIKIRELNKF